MDGERDHANQALQAMPRPTADFPVLAPDERAGRAASLVPPVRGGEHEGAPGEGDAGAVVSDPVNAPAHYRSHPSGIECIAITEHMGFCLGNAVKYIWRADLKADAVQDLEKARWCLDREIARRRKVTP